MTGITKDELIHLARKSGFSRDTDRDDEVIEGQYVCEVCDLENLYNAILERAAVEFPQPHVEACGSEIQERIRALKINTGD